MSWPECQIPVGVFVPGAVLDEQSRAVSAELGCSLNEAVGIIVSLWMFAAEAADENGVIQGNRHALWSAVLSKLDDRIDANQLADCLEAAGIIAQAEDFVTVIGFCKAQEPIKTLRLYNDRLAEKRRLDTKRKQLKRAAMKSGMAEPPVSPPANLLELAGVPVEKPEPKKKTKKTKEAKVAYGDFVHLTPAEYEKLVERFGEEAAKACIDKLDNAKGAKGYTYKSDYRAILNWVADEVKRTRPALFSRSAPVNTHDDNPF